MPSFPERELITSVGASSTMLMMLNSHERYGIPIRPMMWSE